MNMKLKDIKKGPASSRNAEQGYHSFRWEIYEWISSIATKLLMFTPVSANQITILGILCVYISAVLFSFNNIIYSIWAISFLYIGEIMDSIDGTLARCKKTCSRLQSNFLGNIYHSSAYPLLFLGISFGVFFKTGDFIYIIFGSLSTFFQEEIATLRFLKNTIMYKNSSLFRKQRNLLNNSDEKELFLVKDRSKGIIMNLFTIPMQYLRVVIVLSFLLDYLTNYRFLELFVIFYGIFIPIKSIGFSYMIYKSFKRIESNQ